MPAAFEIRLAEKLGREKKSLISAFEAIGVALCSPAQIRL